MLRRTLLATAALVVPIGLLVVTAPQAAWALPNAHGTVSCPVYGGSGSVSPGLTPAGSPGGVKINFKANVGYASGGPCGGTVTSPPGVKVVSGTLTGTGYYNAVAAHPNGSACPNFVGPDVVGKITVVIKWTVLGPPIANTKIVYKNNTGTVTGPPVDTIKLKAPTGTATKTGSFATGVANTTKLVTNLPGPGCGPGPYSAFTITSGAISL